MHADPVGSQGSRARAYEREMQILHERMSVSLSELSVYPVATGDIDNPRVMPISGRGNVRFYYMLTRLAPPSVQPFDSSRRHAIERARSRDERREDIEKYREDLSRASGRRGNV